MAHLEQRATGDRFSLFDRVLVGRSRKCDLRVRHPSVSGEHAVIWWDRDHWWVRDLNSRNGTRLNGQRLQTQEVVELREGAQLGFGHHPVAWSVGCTSPPRPRATSQTGAVVDFDGEVLLLPCPDEPEALIYPDARGGWLMEVADAVRQVEDQEQLQVAGELWRLHLPEPLDVTLDVLRDPPPLERLSLQFVVSADEEHVVLRALGEDQLLELGSRAHH